MDAAGQTAKMPIQIYADYAESLATASLPEKVIHHARRVLIDYMAALLAGSRMPPATLLADALGEEVGTGKASLSGRSVRALPRAAALINGTASHIVEFDDIFRDGIYHPGCPVIAAAIAAAETTGANGDTLLRAIIAGYEVSTRIAAAIQPAHYKFWHTTGTAGTFGAAVAASSVLQLPAAQIAHALASAGTFAAGLQQAFRSDAMSKPLHAGRAAEAGYLAAVSAKAGVTGALDILEGPAGFGRAMSGNVDWDAAVADLGDHFNVTEMTVKNHGCCGHIFASIDGALELQKLHGLKSQDIRSIHVATAGIPVDVTGSKVCSTPFEAKFSTPYAVSHALVYGSVRLDAYDDDHLANSEIARLVETFEVSIDKEADALFPKARISQVTMQLENGKEVTFRQPTRRGDPDAPLSDAELEAKFHELVTPIIGADAGRDLLAKLWKFNASDTVDFMI